MNIEKVFKNLIIIEFIFLFLVIFWGMFGGINEVYVDSDSEEIFFSSAEIILLVVNVVYFINLYLLFKFKPLGKNLYVPLLAFLLGLTFGLPEEYFSQGSATQSVLEALGGLTSGMIIAMLYWTDIKKRFED